MSNSEFIDFISKICKFYERKAPSIATLELWFDVINKINANELDYIFDRIIKDNESYPRNITGLMWALHHEKAGQIVGREREYQHCDYCDGQGLLMMRKEGKNAGQYIEFVFRCAHCRQSTYQYPWGNKYVLVNRGYEEYPLYPGTAKITNAVELQKFINRFGEEESVRKVKEGRWING